MKKGLRFGLVIIALGLAFGSVIAGMAQQQQRPIVGGFKQVAADDPEVVSAAGFAVKEQGRKEGNTVKLISVEKAERQTVAGANYRMCLQVEIKDETNNVIVTQGAKVLVFRGLKKEYSLRSWEEADCSEDD
jgi:hypothetical protein